jgi:hypothetical protein
MIPKSGQPVFAARTFGSDKIVASNEEFRDGA